jgi:hypothetical protein
MGDFVHASMYVLCIQYQIVFSLLDHPLTAQDEREASSVTLVPTQAALLKTKQKKTQKRATTVVINKDKTRQANKKKEKETNEGTGDSSQVMYPHDPFFFVLV